MASSYPRLRSLLEASPLWPFLDRHYSEFAWVRGQSHKVLIELLMRRRKLSVLRVIGLRRAGNHAVIFWYLAQRPGATLFLNDVVRDFALSRRHHMPSHSRLWVRPPYRTPTQLVVSYEDPPLAELAAMPTRIDRFRPRTMMIIRNPYNLFASRLNWPISDIADDPVWRADLVERYKNYARAALARSAPLRGDSVVANYDRWATDEEYRRQLAEELGVPFSDANRDYVTGYGGGSSFEKRRFRNEGSKMAVVDRWRRLEDDPRLREIAADEELRSLSHTIFGETDDLARWLDGCRRDG